MCFCCKLSHMCMQMWDMCGQIMINDSHDDSFYFILFTCYSSYLFFLLLLFFFRQISARHLCHSFERTQGIKHRFKIQSVYCHMHSKDTRFPAE